MSDGDGGGAFSSCCRCCSSFILTSGFAALFLWLSLRTSSPKCYLRNFSLPNPPPSNATVSFDLRLVNPNANKGIYYDAVKVNIFYGPNRSNLLGNFTIQGFYQGHQKKATKGGTIVNATEAILRTVAKNGSAANFRVDIATGVRYKIVFFKTKRQRIAVGAEFQVNGQGNKVAAKDVRLKSSGDRVGGASTPYCHRALLLLSTCFLFFSQLYKI